MATRGLGASSSSSLSDDELWGKVTEHVRSMTRTPRKVAMVRSLHEGFGGEVELWTIGTMIEMCISHAKDVDGVGMTSRILGNVHRVHVPEEAVAAIMETFAGKAYRGTVGRGDRCRAERAEMLVAAKALCSDVHRALCGAALEPPLPEGLQTLLTQRAALIKEAGNPETCLFPLGEFLGTCDLALSRAPAARRYGRLVWKVWRLVAAVHENAMPSSDPTRIYGDEIEHFDGCPGDGEDYDDYNSDFSDSSSQPDCTCRERQRPAAERIADYAASTVLHKRMCAYKLESGGRARVMPPRELRSLSEAILFSGPRLGEDIRTLPWDNEGDEEVPAANAGTSVGPLRHRLEPEHVPPELVCPIGLSVLQDPVLAVGDGYTYERANIEKWFASKATSPVTADPLTTTDVAVNHLARSMLQRLAVELKLDAAASPTALDAFHASNHQPWPAGTKVTVHELIKAAELNGRSGTIVEWMAATGRYKVDLQGLPKSIKPANLSRTQ